MKTSEFLFPHDLEVTPTGLRKILFIGSCLAEAYVTRIRAANPATTYDFILFNNAADLPEKTAEEVEQYDLQYIQLPLRSVLTDAAIRVADTQNASADWLEIGRTNIDMMLDKAMSYNEQYGLLSIISTFIAPQNHVAPSLYEARSSVDLTFIVHELNNYLAEKTRKHKNAYLADVEIIASSLGKQYFLDDFIAFYTHSSVHYPDWGEGDRIEPVPPFAETYENRVEEFFGAVFRQIEAIYRTAKQLDQVKVVIFDLDNTMWRGQLAEHYGEGMAWPQPHGWPLGIWEAVHHLRWRGIAVALASKNDHEVVVAKWDQVVEPPFVKFDDFIIKHISWQPKVESVASILEALSLTAKSAVFVDDHPVERAAVKAAFPEIRVIGSNPYLTRRILLWSAETQLPRRTEETMRREQMFGSQIEREQARVAMPRDLFLVSLKATLNLFELGASGHKSFPRVSELVNKTNQFNTTGVRRSLQDYEAFWTSGGRIFAFSVEDRFTDYGLVGVIFAKDGEIAQFVMSCRVLGMDIEIAALSQVVRQLRLGGAVCVFGNRVPTEVNGPCRDVFLRSGFHRIDADGERFEIDGADELVFPKHVNINFSGT